MIVIAAMFTSVLVLSGTPGLTPEADALVTCTASDEATLNACIGTYNGTPGIDGPVVVSLVANIELSATATTISNLSNTQLELHGNGYTISAAAGFPPNSDLLRQTDGLTIMTNLTLMGATDDGFDVDAGLAGIRNSTFVGNQYGLCACSADVVLVSNSTFFDNTTDGIWVSSGGSVDVDLSTFVDNGRHAIRVSGTTSVTDSLLAGSGNDECAATVTDGGGNVIEDTSCGTAATPSVAGTYDSSLADNGCAGCNQTIKLLPHSPAIDAAGTCLQSFDQRAEARPALAACDAGAFEFTTPLDCPSSFSVDDELGLNTMIRCYNAATSGTTTVSFVDDITASASLVAIDNDDNAELLIDGAGYTLDLASVAKLIQNDGSSTVERLTALGGIEDAIRVFGGSMLVENSTFTGNLGGLGASSTGSLTVVNSTIAHNTQVGIFANSSVPVHVRSTTVVANGNNGLFTSGVGSSVMLQDSLVAGHTVNECSGDGTFTDLGGNVTEEGTCGAAATPSVAGTFSPSLENNGCATPCTQTIALHPNSPAIDAAGTCAEAFDQRGAGFPRTLGADCDAGAFEAPAVVCPPGRYSATGTAPCTPAPIGSYVPGAGATSATPCAVGTWSYSVGSTSCDVLPLCDGKKVTIVWGPGATATGGADVILGTSGNDTIDALGGNDTVCAGDGNDVVVGGDGDDRLFGENGRDIARGNTGSDYVDGGPGNDRLLGGIGDDELHGRDGDDYLGGFGGNDTITGGPGDETIYGGYGADTISGGDGHDTIHGLIGNDTIDGGSGNDVLNGDAGSDTIAGGPGADTVNGGNAGDILRGNGGNDSVNGGRADDLLSGGPGTDVCVGNKHFSGDTTDGSCETVFGVP